MIEPETIDELKEYLEKENHCFLLYFTATWCGPCRRIYPLLLTLQEKLQCETFEIIKIDIDVHEEFCDKNNIRSVPTFFVFKNGNVLSQCEGADIHKVGEILKGNI